jgi:hypothetical protein
MCHVNFMSTFMSTTKKGTSQSKLRSVLNIDMLDILTF